MTNWRISEKFPVAAIVLGLSVGVLPSAPAAAQVRLSEVANQARIEQKPGARIPADLEFADEQGDPVRLATLFTDRPALLVLAYYTCPDLCPMTLRHLTEGLNGIAMRSGKEFDVVVVSFDPHDTPAAAQSKRIENLRAYKGGSAAPGWHFLAGRQAAIDRMCDAVGFRRTYDVAHHRFAHAAGIMVVAPGGMLSHYFFGVDYAPADLESALQDAAAGKTTAVDQPFQQYCFAYDPASSGKGRIVMISLRLLGAAWVLAVVGYIGAKIRRDFRGGRFAARRGEVAPP